MDNYEYLVAGLPVLSSDWSARNKLSASALITEIRSLSSDRDNALYDTLLKGYEEENYNPEFYKSVLAHPNDFIRSYFRYDLGVRNAKVRFVNQKLGRPSDTDIFMEEDEDFEEAQEVDRILHGRDLLDREKDLDMLTWNKVGELNTFDYFNVSALLGYIVKLKIVERWLSLDEETGRDMFRKLVEEIRGTFKGVDFNEQ
ncbi:MAG: DUF2764 family protein [Candidatus Methanomethylophilaceae archaeon]|nr:DUF2764 family protein [Candidatus Methanomethylophilaceae archaeon]